MSLNFPSDAEIQAKKLRNLQKNKKKNKSPGSFDEVQEDAPEAQVWVLLCLLPQNMPKIMRPKEADKYNSSKAPKNKKKLKSLKACFSNQNWRSPKNLTLYESLSNEAQA